MPLLEMVGKAGMDSPWQYELPMLNEGVTLGTIETVTSTDEAHSSASGVNVYVVVVWLLMVGAQVPLMPLLEVVGSGGKAEFWQ